MKPSKRKIRALAEALRASGSWALAERRCGLYRGAAKRYARSRPELRDAQEDGRRALWHDAHCEAQRQSARAAVARAAVVEASRLLCRTLAGLSWGQVVAAMRNLELVNAQALLEEGRARRAQNIAKRQASRTTGGLL